MRIHKFDGKKYVALGDLYHYFKVCMNKAKEGTEPGWICTDEKERARGVALCVHMLAGITADDIDREMCKTPDDIAVYHAKLFRQYLRDRYIIASLNEEDVDGCFSRFEDREDGTDGVHVIFTTDWRYAELYDDAAEAYEMAQAIKDETGDSIKLKVMEAQRYFLRGTPEERLLGAIFSNRQIDV